MANGTEQRLCLLYLRVSSEDQDTDDKVSLAEQELAAEEYCQRNGIVIFDRFSDVAPGSTKNRPDFQRMLSKVREGTVNVVLCWAADRLARGVSPATALLEALDGTDITMESTMNGVIDRNYFVLMALFGGMELENLRERSAMGKRGRARLGIVPSRNICYGYTVDGDGKPAIDEEAARVVEYIYDLSIDKGMGSGKIAKRLNLEKIPTPGGGSKGWAQSVVLHILRDATYKGVWNYGQRRHRATERGMVITPQPEENWIPIEVPQIIDEKRWQIAQNLIDGRRLNSPRNTKSFYLLQGILHCTACNRKVGGRTTKNRVAKKKGRTYRYPVDPPRRYYECYGIMYDHTDCRSPRTIKAERIEPLIWSALVDIVGDPMTFISGLESQSLDNNRLAKITEQINDANQSLEKLNQISSGLIQMRAGGEVTKEEFEAERAEIRERQSHYIRVLDGLTEQQAVGELEEDQKDRFKEWVATLEPILDELTDGQRQALMKDVFTRIDIDGKNRITLSIGLPGNSSVAIESEAPLP